MADLILTHKDCKDIQCACHGALKSDGGSAILRVNGSPVLLENEVKEITSDCATKDDTSKGLKKCRKANMMAGKQSLLTVKGGKPVTVQLAGLTDGTNPVLVQFKFQGSSRSVLRVGGAGGTSKDSASSAGAAGQTAAAAAQKEAAQKKLKPGVHLGSREHAVPGAGRPATHHFLVLVPEDEGQVPDAHRGHLTSLGEGMRGLVASAKNTGDHLDVVQEVKDRRDHLEGEINGESDLSATRQWFNPESKLEKDWRPDARLQPPPAGLTVDQFIVKILESFDRYQENAKIASDEYPLLGGMVLRLPGEKCFNSNSWALGLIEAGGGKEIPPEDADLHGFDACQENRIPPYFFRDNNERLQATTQRRNLLRQQAASAPSRIAALKVITRAAVDAVGEDSNIANKAGMCLEDLRLILLGDSPDAEETRIQGDFVGDTRFLIIKLRAAASAATDEEDFVEAVIAGLCFGYYSEVIARAVATIGIVFKGAEGHPVAYMEGVDLGTELVSGSLRLESLPDEIDSLANDLAS